MASENSHAPGNGTRTALAEWLLEVSALLAVFPWLDQVVLHDAPGGFNWRVAAGTFHLALGFLCIGPGLLAQERSRRIGLFCAATVFLAIAAVVSFWR